MAPWLLASMVMAAQPAVILRPNWRTDQVFTFTLTRRERRVAGDGPLGAIPSGTLTRQFDLRVTGARPEGGITAELVGLHGPVPMTAMFDADGALVSLDGRRISNAVREALGLAFLPGYKRPLESGGTWAAILERGGAQPVRYLMDVALRLESVGAGAQGREARVHADLSFAGPADPLPGEASGEAAETGAAYEDGLTGTGQILFDLDRGVIRHAEYSWRTSFARRVSDGAGPAYEVKAGAIETRVTLDLEPEPAR